MLKVAEIQFITWDSLYWCDVGDFDLKIKEKVIVKTDLGVEMGVVVGIKEIAEQDMVGKELKPIMRKANLSD